MEAINDSLKNVTKCIEMIKKYLALNDIENDALLEVAIELLETASEELSKAV